MDNSRQVEVKETFPHDEAENVVDAEIIGTENKVPREEEEKSVEEKNRLAKIKSDEIQKFLKS